MHVLGIINPCVKTAMVVHIQYITNTNIRTYIHTYMYAYTHKHTHVYIHTYMYTGYARAPDNQLMR